MLPRKIARNQIQHIRQLFSALRFSVNDLLEKLNAKNGDRVRAGLKNNSIQSATCSPYREPWPLVPHRQTCLKTQNTI